MIAIPRLRAFGAPLGMTFTLSFTVFFCVILNIQRLLRRVVAFLSLTMTYAHLPAIV
jgi:hypothetical protein